jgi:gas vesicle protein
MTESDMTYGKKTQKSSPGIQSGLLYLLIGGGIGAALALLFAPKSGADLRTDISDLTRKGYDGTLELANQLKEQSAGLYQTVKEKTDKVYEMASSKLSLAQQTIDNSIETAGDKVNGEIRQLEDKAPHSSPGGGRKSADIL